MTTPSDGTDGTDGTPGAASPDAARATEETAQRIRQMTEQLIANSKQAGIANLDAYEKSLASMLEMSERTAGATGLEWVDALATAHARWVQDVSKAYTDAARTMLT